jgi:hypothetical protein
MSNQFDNWGSGQALTDALLQGVQGQIQHPNIPPLQNPDRSLVNQFEQHPEPSSPLRKV